MAVILSIYVLALSIPVSADTCCAESSGCQTEQHGQHDCTGCCSPFSICNACGFTIENIVRTEETKLQEISIQVTPYQQPFYSDSYINGIWQPPKSA
ncbi:MAG: hypothetical protein LBR55_05920 [Bacteroidales bacterium]|nr:hypothetical protein [Bacteroidales bacterium]